MKKILTVQIFLRLQDWKLINVDFQGIYFLSTLIITDI